MKILLIADGIALTTGFAQVTRRVATALVGLGHEVAQLACLDNAPFCRSEPYAALGVKPYFPGSDKVGMTVIRETVMDFQPDRIFINADPGMALGWLNELAGCWSCPVLLYTPVEGAPVPRFICQTFAIKGASTVLYTEWAHDRVLEQSGLDLPWVWHGVDREAFHPLTAGDRGGVRESLGWEDRYVITYVARNRDRKAQDLLIEAMPEVRRRIPNALLYLHCASWDNFWMGGWDLARMVQDFDVEDAVQFASQESAVRGERTPSLARKLASSDLYVHPAEVEGFGLPIIEAMACGIPTITVADGGNMAEVAGDAPAFTVYPERRRAKGTGELMALTTPEQWAQSIGWTHDGPDWARESAERGFERSKLFDWDAMVAQLCQRLYTAGEQPPEGIAAEAVV